MQRRAFITAAAAAAAVGAFSGSITAEAALERQATLLALAGTVVPLGEATLWNDSPVATALIKSYAALEQDRRQRCAAALAALDAKAGRGGFAALDMKEKTDLVRRLQADDQEYARNFAPLRSLILDVYFSSEAGQRYTGYKDTSQFKGYPEHVKLAREWE